MPTQLLSSTSSAASSSDPEFAAAARFAASFRRWSAGEQPVKRCAPSPVPAAGGEAPVLRLGAPPLVQFRCLLGREFKSGLRNPRMLKGKVIVTLIPASLVGCIFFQVPATQTGAQDRIYLLTTREAGHDY